MSTLQTVQNVINTTESVVNQVDTSFTKYIMIIVTFVVYQSKKILKFLIDKNVVSAGIAIIVGTQISKITGAFVDNLLGPFINLILAGKTKNFEDYEIEIFTVHFKVGLFLSNLIQFLINMSLVYYIFQISQVSNFDAFLNQSVAIGTMTMQQ